MGADYEPREEHPLSTEQVLSKLKPEVFTYDNGKKRTIYTFNNIDGDEIRAIFFTPGELPYSANAMGGRQIFFYGERPKQRSEQEWTEYVKSLREISKDPFSPLKPVLTEVRGRAIEQENALFLVEANVVDFLDFAFNLGINDFNLREARKEAHGGRFNETANNLMDQMIAGKIIDDTGRIRLEQNQEGEALMILSLLGNLKAQAILSNKMQALKQIDQAEEEKIHTDLDESITQVKHSLQIAVRHAIEDLSFEKLSSSDYLKRVEEIDKAEGKKFEAKDLVLVRVTPHLPRKTTDHQGLPTPFDWTGRSLPRLSIHFSLNHIFGRIPELDLSGIAYVIIAPLDKTIALNGLPRSLNAADTYFDISPGSLLTLPPETVIVKPAKLPEGTLFEDRGQNVLYKTQDFTPQDITEFNKQIVNQDINNHLLTSINEGIVNELNSALSDQVSIFWNNVYQGESDENISRMVSSRVFEDQETLSSVLGHTTLDVPDWLSVLSHKPLGEPVTSLVKRMEEAGLGPKISSQPEALMRSCIEKVFAAEIQKLAVQAKLSQMGYKWISTDAWGNAHNEIDNSKLRLLALELGVPPMPHVGDPINELEGFLGIRLLEDGKDEFFTNHEERDRLLNLWLDKVPQKARRMLYLLGVL